MPTEIKNGSFEEASHCYRDSSGREIPSVTQILDSVGLIDLDNIPGDTLEQKRLLGDSVHYACRLIDQTNDLDWDSVHPDTVGYIVAYENFCKKAKFEPERDWVEKSMIHQANGMSYGLTIDRVGRLSGVKHRCVVELKCTYKPETSWRIQTAAYELAVPKKDGEYIGRLAVQLRKDGTFQLFLHENPRDKDMFLYCLAVIHWKINEKISWKKER
jgi:hypothetical protein